jgi:hypothetical protein
VLQRLPSDHVLLVLALAAIALALASTLVLHRALVAEPASATTGAQASAVVPAR